MPKGLCARTALHRRCWFAGQTNILRRDAVFPALSLDPNGPSMVRRSTEGSPVMSNPSTVVRRNGLMRSSFSASLRRMVVAAML